MRLRSAAEWQPVGMGCRCGLAGMLSMWCSLSCSRNSTRFASGPLDVSASAQRLLKIFCSCSAPMQGWLRTNDMQPAGMVILVARNYVMI